MVWLLGQCGNVAADELGRAMMVEEDGRKRKGKRVPRLADSDVEREGKVHDDKDGA